MLYNKVYIKLKGIVDKLTRDKAKGISEMLKVYGFVIDLGFRVSDLGNLAVAVE
jgi:hypothetical protein